MFNPVSINRFLIVLYVDCLLQAWLMHQQQEIQTDLTVCCGGVSLRAWLLLPGDGSKYRACTLCALFNGGASGDSFT